MNEILSTSIVGLVSAFTTGFCSWFFTKKKYNVEVNGNEIENLQRSLDFYIKLSDDTNARLGEILDKNQSLDTQVSQLKEENAELKELVEQQNVQIKAQNTLIEKQSNQIEKLTEQVESLLTFLEK